MGKIKVSGSSEPSRRMRPALNPDSRENQLVALAVDLAEEQLRNGTASAQVITHYLKLGSSLAQLEKEKIALNNELTKAKTKAVANAEDTKKLYDEAMAYFRRYSGQADSEDDY